jgi:hypothetical protein
MRARFRRCGPQERTGAYSIRNKAHIYVRTLREINMLWKGCVHVCPSFCVPYFQTYSKDFYRISYLCVKRFFPLRISSPLLSVTYKLCFTWTLVRIVSTIIQGILKNIFIVILWISLLQNVGILLQFSSVFWCNCGYLTLQVFIFYVTLQSPFVNSKIPPKWKWYRLTRWLIPLHKFHPKIPTYHLSRYNMYNGS